ncbi:unnamed protein product [Ophioblennius macclurei]
MGEMMPQLILISLLSLTWTTAAAWPCTQTTPSQPPPATVNTVKPSDVAAFAAIGLHRHRTEMLTIVSRLEELMNLFRPDLISHPSDESKFLQHSSVEQAKEVISYLSDNQDIDVNQDWKLVLLVVPMDQLCACQQQQAASAIRAAVEEVDEILQLLHSQLKQTLVSVTLWDGEIESSKCSCVETDSEGELRFQRAMLTQALQESLDELMVKKRWYSDRQDFAVTLQDVPLITEPESVITGKPLSSSGVSHHIDRLTVRIWTNLLQPTVGQHGTENNGEILSLPCPTEDRPFLRTEGNSPSNPHRDASSVVAPLTGTEMPCDDFSPSPSIPTSVHELRPADIKIVAAVGDSLTAGNGIASSQNDILDVLTQYRGLSWSVGGDQNLTTVTTLPNILKYFNPNVTGYSLSKGSASTPQAFFNQAVPGSKSRDVPSQVEALVARMKSESSINYGSDWKVITLFIGGNDMCDHCYNSLLHSVDNYFLNVRNSLDYLHKEVPRALVNLVEVLHITPLREMHLDASLKCPTWLVDYMCPCVIMPKTDSTALQMVEEMNRNYQEALHRLVESGRYDTRSDFTVVIQPFFRDVIVPRLEDGRPDRSYFSADCFHLSQKAQTLMARSLWNNMLEPLGNKTAKHDFSVSVNLKCPTKSSPYIRTYKNSDYVYSGPTPTPEPITNWGSDFSCSNFSESATVPTSVHKLRPADIKVVAALGDYVTAGTGAKATSSLLLERDYRGVSWSIGGDNALENVTTLPNILKKFNPLLKGFSKGFGATQRGFNMAAAGAKTSQIPDQVQALIKQMKEHKEVNFETDWKLVTIFIGGNDLCHYCLDQNNLSPNNYSHNLMLGLDMLQKEVPRVLVSVVELMEMDVLKTIKKDTLACSLLQKSGCPCVSNPMENSPELEELKRINYKYQTEIQYLLSGDRYEGKEDFAVVLQPFLHNSFIPYIGVGEPDTSFFSMDCFHLSERAHAEMAIALWNNMLEPVGQKQAYNNFTYDRSKIRCPSELSPFIFTKVNSQPDSPTSPPSITTPPATTTKLMVTQPMCDEPLPVWVPVVVGVASLLAGVLITGLSMHCCQRRKSKAQKAFGF